MPPKKCAEASAAGAATTAAATKNPWWKQPEVVVLLSAVRSVLPLGEYHWQSVATQYNSTRPNGSVERNTDSCKTKFKALKNTRKPTGVAGMPWDVNEAKEIQRLIEAKMCTAEMDDFDGDGDEVAAEAAVPDGDCSESESEEGAPVEGEEGAPTESQSSTSQPQQSTTPIKRTSSASVSGSPAEKALDGVPQRLGVVAHQAGVVASTATAKRIKLEKQIAEEKQQRAASADARNLMISSMMAQQQQQHQLQMQQNQQMQMMMMMMMSKMCGVPLSELQLPMQMPPPPSNPLPPQQNE